MTQSQAKAQPERLSTGGEGLDTILNGGLIAQRCYLVRGGPGCGKTTLGMHFLSEGARCGEQILYITLGESRLDLQRNAAAIGIDTSQIDFLDLSPESSFFTDSSNFALFTPAEVDQDAITHKIIERIKQINPSRVFLDSTSHLRYLSLDAHRFRQQLLSFVRFLIEQNVTLLLTSESTANCPDDDVTYLSDGVIALGYRGQHRCVEVTKFRGSSSLSGPHTIRLTSEGMRVFVAMRYIQSVPLIDHKIIKTGVGAIDQLIGGGIETGTVSLVTGPAGVGKTTLASQFVLAAAQANMPCVIFQFEESTASLLHRASQVGMPLDAYVESKHLRMVEIDLSHISEDEVACLLRREVEQYGAKMVIFDSISGYSLCLSRTESFLPLRNLFQYLKSKGITTIAINETQSVTGDFRPTEIGISFMADNIFFLRFLELDGEMRKAIGVLKKRMSNFERYLRDFSITSKGIKVGAPMTGLRDILRGVPQWVTGAPKTTPSTDTDEP
jgi:circadian clock protein KaiC